MRIKRKKKHVIDGELNFYLFGKYYDKRHTFEITRNDVKKFRLSRKLKKEIWKLHFLYMPNSEPIDLNWDLTMKKEIVFTRKWYVRCKEGVKINQNTKRLIKVCCRIINNYYKFQNRRCMGTIKMQREMFDMIKDEFMKLTGIDADFYKERTEQEFKNL